MEEKKGVLIHLLIGLFVLSIGLLLIYKILWLSMLLSFWGVGMIIVNVNNRERLDFENLNIKYWKIYKKIIKIQNVIRLDIAGGLLVTILDM